MTKSLLELFEAWLAGKADDAERVELLRLLSLAENKELSLRLIRQAIEADDALSSGEITVADDRLALILQSILATDELQYVHETPVVPIPSGKKHWLRYAAAIAALFVLAAGLYLTVWNARNTSSKELTDITTVKPGGDRAVLTLSDGREIILDSTTKGQLAEDGNVLIIKNANGEIVYDAQKANDEVMMNTMTTPRGGQYQLILPDGTKVWLNAASTLHYPTAFKGDKRMVEINGEAYFDVKKDPAKPFFVRINDQAEVQVTGTSFNINSYADEPTINTTLIEGSVKLLPDVKNAEANDGRNLVLLVPGQQARVAHNGNMYKKDVTPVLIEKADIEKVIAWKNGLFNFEGSKLKDAMRQMARWYDIDIVYDEALLKKGTQNALLVGGISRDLSLADVLEVFSALGLHFRLEEGRRLVLLP